MSEAGSIISEEDILPNDGSDSESYNPYQESFEDQNSRNFISKDASASLDRSDKQIGKVDTEEQEYSESFDEDDPVPEISKAYTEDFEPNHSTDIGRTYSDTFEPDISRAYSENFEASASQSYSHGNSKSNLFRKTADNRRGKSSYNILSGLDMQSLQAELALDELSKEVVRLRNQQREIVRNRKIKAREKKIRAEERRLRYLSELKAQESAVIELRSKLSACEDTVAALQAEVLSLQDRNLVLQTALDTSQHTIQNQRREIESAEEALKESHRTHEAAILELRERGDTLSREKSELAQQLARKNMMLEVIHSSIDASEDRCENLNMTLRTDAPTYASISFLFPSFLYTRINRCVVV